MKKVTLQTVAEIAGVSRGTVDRVLNNRTNVSPDVYERVMNALKETGYLSPRDSYQKKVLSQNFTPIKLGVLLPNWTGHFKWEIQRGIDAAEAELSDFYVRVITEECESEIPDEIINRLDNLVKQGVQAIALCAINDPSIEKKISEYKTKGIPTITYNSDLPNSERLCFIGQDYSKSGRIAAEILSKCISCNSNVIASVGNLEFNGHYLRLQGFIQRMQENGFNKSQIKVIETYNDYQITYQKVLTELKQDKNIHGIYMANRSVAGCTKAVEAVDNKREIRIICHDISEHTKSLLQDGSIDFSITQDIFNQGYLPLVYLRDFLHKGKIPPHNIINTNISIICSQNM